MKEDFWRLIANTNLVFGLKHTRDKTAKEWRGLRRCNEPRYAVLRGDPDPLGVPESERLLW